MCPLLREHSQGCSASLDLFPTLDLEHDRTEAVRAAGDRNARALEPRIKIAAS